MRDAQAGHQSPHLADTSDSLLLTLLPRQFPLKVGKADGQQGGSHPQVSPKVRLTPVTLGKFEQLIVSRGESISVHLFLHGANWEVAVSHTGS